MNSVLLKNDIGESVVANVIRYFKYNNEIYMIYTMNEIDSSNYIKLYGIKILNDQKGTFTATSIDDSQWSGIVTLIKEMVKPLEQRNINDFEELSASNISTINLVSKRVFKINKDMADLLIANANIVTKQETNTTTVDNDQNRSISDEKTEIEQNSVENTDAEINYKDLYENELEKNTKLSQEIENLKSKLLTIENIING